MSLHRSMIRGLICAHPDKIPTVAERLDSLVNSSISMPRTIHGLITMVDAEFSGLWKYIHDWQGVFRHFDRDRSGSIDGVELAEALRSFGYNLPPNILTLVEQKYSTSCACHAAQCDFVLSDFRDFFSKSFRSGWRVWASSWNHL